MKKWIVTGFGVVIIAVIIIVIMITNNSDDVDMTADQTIALTVEDAVNVGSVSLDIIYDPTVIEIVEVKIDGLAKNAMMEYNAETLGQVTIGIVDSNGIKGSGNLVKLGFNVLDQHSVSNITIENVKAHDAESLIDVISETYDGQIDASDGSVLSPGIRFK